MRDEAALEKVRIPQDFSFAGLPGLRREIIEKLMRHQPENLGQASRISGVTPAALQLMRVHLRDRGATAAVGDQGAFSGV